MVATTLGAVMVWPQGSGRATSVAGEVGEAARGEQLPRRALHRAEHGGVADAAGAQREDEGGRFDGLVIGVPRLLGQEGQIHCRLILSDNCSFPVNPQARWRIIRRTPARSASGSARR